MQNFLEQIHEGMKVFDSARHEIGKVEYVRLSDDNPATAEAEAVTPGTLPEHNDSLMENIAEVFAPDDGLPDEIRDRLLQQGFVRIDSDGLFAADRYVTPDQIGSISADALTLNVTRDELVRRD